MNLQEYIIKVVPWLKIANMIKMMINRMFQLRGILLS